MEITKHQIKRAVSLYSFQEEYFLRKMNLEEILRTVSELGIPGVEIIGDQMIPRYPDVPESFYEQWRRWLDQYALTPICLDMFLDWNKFDGRVMTFEEKLDSVRKDILAAHKLGCTVIRVISRTDPEVVAALAPEAEKYNVRLGVEIHSPMHIDDPYEQKLIEIYQKVNSPYLGFVPDMGIFVKRFPRVISERWIRDGMKPEIAAFIVDAYDSQTGLDTLSEDIRKLGGNEADVARASTAKHMVNTNPQRLVDYMPYMFHIHAKFYEMLPNCREYSIPYEDVIPALIAGGFKGYLSSEYEGNRHIQDAFEVDSREQVRRQQEMFKELLGEA